RVQVGEPHGADGGGAGRWGNVQREENGKSNGSVYHGAPFLSVGNGQPVEVDVAVGGEAHDLVADPPAVDAGPLGDLARRPEAGDIDGGLHDPGLLQRSPLPTAPAAWVGWGSGAGVSTVDTTRRPNDRNASLMNRRARTQKDRGSRSPSSTTIVMRSLIRSSPLSRRWPRCARPPSVWRRAYGTPPRSPVSPTPSPSPRAGAGP